MNNGDGKPWLIYQSYEEVVIWMCFGITGKVRTSHT